MSERVIVMHRFFIDEDLIEGESLKIKGSDFRHISRSLRLQPGDEIIACPGDGRDFTVQLENFKDDYAEGKIINSRQNKSEPDLNITLAQAIPKNKNMELVVQKCTEIGIKEIIPLFTARTIVKLTDKKKKKRCQRWQRIAEEAAKQSQRGIIPQINDIHNLKKIIDIQNDFDLIIICWTGEKAEGLKNIFSRVEMEDINEVLLLVGPEGGFRTDEIELICQQAGGYSLSLGDRILRTETAGFVTLSLLLYEAGDIGG